MRQTIHYLLGQATAPDAAFNAHADYLNTIRFQTAKNIELLQMWCFGVDMRAIANLFAGQLTKLGINAELQRMGVKPDCPIRTAARQPKKFNTSFKDDVQRANHGKIWTTNERLFLYDLWQADCTLQQMCETMQRPKDGILSKLAEAGFMTWDGTRYVVNQRTPKPEPDFTNLEKRVTALESEAGDLSYGTATLIRVVGTGDVEAFYKQLYDKNKTTTGRSAKSYPEFQTTPKETTVTIETRTFINGVDASSLSDDQIFGEIAKIEKKIDTLKAVKTISKKLQKTIDEQQALAQKLADYVDAR